MSRLNRCRQAGGRTGQHHGRTPVRRLSNLLSVAALAFALITTPAQSQTLLRIQVLEGEGSVNGAGTRSQRAIAVQLTDETGRPLEGIAVSFRLPEEGPSGAFESGMKTEVIITSADGRAAIHGIRWNRTPGPFQLRVTAAKGESRAGTIVSQYISDRPVSKTQSSLLSKGGSSKKKWIAIAALAAGGAIAAGMAGGGGGSSTPQQPTQPPPVAQPPQIGLPTISITGN